MVQISEYINVKEHAKGIGCNIPTSIAVLPSNFEISKSKRELLYESTAPTVRVLWRQNGIIETPLEQPGDKFPYQTRKAFEWVGPTLFISSMLLSQDPHGVTIALNVISNYLTDWFRGIPRNRRNAKFEIVIETKGGHYRKIEYEGAPEGIKDLPEVIREISDE